jgi:hypothetical protein
MKNSIDTIRNRTRDLLACSAVPQPTAPPRAPSSSSSSSSSIIIIIIIISSSSGSSSSSSVKASDWIRSKEDIKHACYESQLLCQDLNNGFPNTKQSC